VLYRKPETFDFLGFTHMCGLTTKGRFWVKRKTISKRMRAKLAEANKELKRRRHQPIPEQGRWLRSVVSGHLAYYAVPGNTNVVAAFRTQVTRHCGSSRDTCKSGKQWIMEGPCSAWPSWYDFRDRRHLGTALPVHGRADSPSQ
jgi:hypothetical protein